MLLRTEDGGFVNTTVPGAPAVSVPVWQWLRLETGEDVLAGPAHVVSVKESSEVRAGPGDVALLTIGTAS